MPKCDFNKVAKHDCSPVNLLHICRTVFPKSTSEGVLSNATYVLLITCKDHHAETLFISKFMSRSIYVVSV